jgi:hypothetical protein
MCRGSRQLAGFSNTGWITNLCHPPYIIARMSRSRRKTPIFGITTARSEKQDKRLANRKLRHAVAGVLHVRPESVLPTLREVSDVWGFDKDGKSWWGEAPAKEMRK